MPVINLPTFINDIEKSGASAESPGVSLLLFQAVMFSATAFVHIKHLHAAGFATRKEARRLFFQKTRLLYDFDYESDRITLIQTLLFMTLWHETLDDEKGAWHWIGVAISLAETMGMGRISGLATTPKERLWKRIWWACFIRDQMIVLGMRRPGRIGRGNFNTTMLEESDFEIQALRASFATVPEECMLLQDTGMQRQIVVIYISQARLCCSLSQVLESQYSIQPKLGLHDPAGSTMMLLPRNMIDNDALSRIDAELQDWRSKLPTCCQYQIPAKTDMKCGRASASLQRTLLHMLYNTTVITLHRPNCLSATSVGGDALERSRARMVEAAVSVSQMASDLQRAGGERFLPGTGVTVLVPAIMVHVIRMRSPVISETYQSALRAFNQGRVILDSLCETYCSADTSIQLLDIALQPPVSPVAEAASEPGASAESEMNQLAQVSTSSKEEVQMKPPGSPSDLLSFAPADQDDADAEWSASAFEDDLMALAAAVGIEAPSLRDAGCRSVAKSSGGEPWVQKMDSGVDSYLFGEV
ncbi:hypothetical protein CEP51_004725 [Fusarium floridanum]|uniref:Xylanolytic transcriptional activator regulatory domain-containing protein n=1 Tax=Fusarium floridanum TaxID=1325733 RepID=A0A428RZW7_9HYPO|nr:hypothetical protein CEP51_004725 [Fusarium floridanum]